MNLYPLSLCYGRTQYVHADYISNLVLSSFFHKQTNVAGCMLLLVVDCVGTYVWCGCNKKAKKSYCPNLQKLNFYKKLKCNKRTNGIHGSLKFPPQKKIKNKNNLFGSLSCNYYYFDGSKRKNKKRRYIVYPNEYHMVNGQILNTDVGRFSIYMKTLRFQVKK